jgi:hypothetical protein
MMAPVCRSSEEEFAREGVENAEKRREEWRGKLRITLSTL